MHDDRHPIYDNVIGIDLGASYTKVSRRTGLRACQYSDVDTDILALHEQWVIPSICVQRRSGSHEWLFGVDAAEATLADGDVLFANWKADLFSDARSEYVQSIHVAAKFFKWLREMMEASGIDLGEYTTRLCLPMLPVMEETASILAQCMDREGWAFPRNILKVSEPAANIIGIFTDGKNCVSSRGIPHYEQCYGSSNIINQMTRLRPITELDTEKFVTVGVLDIGSFTTDVAALRFNLSGIVHPEDPGIERIDAESWPCGITANLDDVILPALSEANGFDLSTLKFSLRETAKERLYAEKRWTLGVDRRVDFGGASDQKVIKDTLQQFCHAVFNRCESFFTRMRPEILFMTGGGAAIPLVRQTLADGIERMGIRVRPFPDGIMAAPGKQSDWVSWMVSQLTLNRFATALGGASVVLDATAPPSRSDTTEGGRPAAELSSGVVRQSCRCQGGNKDCCFCGGSGFYVKR